MAVASSTYSAHGPWLTCDVAERSGGFEAVYRLGAHAYLDKVAAFNRFFSDYL